MPPKRTGMLMSQWSGRWGKSTDKIFADYMKELAGDWARIAALTTPAEVIDVLKVRMDTWLDALQTDASKYVDDLAVLTRDRVHDYFLALWLWHRLDSKRWDASKLQLRETKRGSLSLDVDHVVAVKLWETLANGQAQIEDEADEQALSVEDLSTTMNALGNCCLLEKSFNIAKGAEPFAGFLGRVHEFKSGELKIDDWTKDLGVDATLVDPSGKSTAEVRTVVEARTVTMKTELKEYLVGVRQRADV